MSSSLRLPFFPARLSPRLLRPLVLLAIFGFVGLLGHLTLKGGRYSLRRREQSPFNDGTMGTEWTDDLEDTEQEYHILPLQPIPEPVDIVPEWLDQPSPPEPQKPARQTPWLPNPIQTINYPLRIKDSTVYMHNRTIPSLLHAPPPSTFQCTDDDSFGPLLLVGVFSTAESWKQRSVLRTLQRRGLNPRSPPVDFRFILGQPNASLPAAEIGKLQTIVALEQEVHGDLVVLDVEENMDEGKTWAFFRWAGSLPEGQRGRFVMKADQDTLLILPNVLHSFSLLSCSTPLYWGTYWGSCGPCYPLYMRGLAYALSSPLVRWLAAASPALTVNETRGIEDIRTAGFFTSLPAEEGEVQVVDWGWRMGDWYGGSIPKDVHTVALHSMKSPEFWIEIHQQMVDIWTQAGWEYTWPPLEDE